MLIGPLRALLTVPKTPPTLTHEMIAIAGSGTPGMPAQLNAEEAAVAGSNARVCN